MKAGSGGWGVGGGWGGIAGVLSASICRKSASVFRRPPPRPNSRASSRLVVTTSVAALNREHSRSEMYENSSFRSASVTPLFDDAGDGEDDDESAAAAAWAVPAAEAAEVDSGCG